MAILVMSCLLSLFGEDAKGAGWRKVGSVSRTRNRQHGSLNALKANGSDRLLTGRRPLPHSRLSLKEPWKEEIGHVPPWRPAAKRSQKSDIVGHFLSYLDILGKRWQISAIGDFNGRRTSSQLANG